MTKKKADDCSASAALVLLAFKVVWSRYEEVKSIYAASSRGQAKNLCFKAIRQAGYNPKWLDLSAVRASTWDTNAAALGRPGFIRSYEC